MTNEPIAYAAVAADGSESIYVSALREQAEEACREYGWALVPLYATQPCWIPVDERLPEESVEVLAFADGRRCNAEWWRSGWWHACQGFERRGGRILKRVTHWMPLPAPPADAK
ncbi:MAG: DUF551 domain-containing protein [Planctomycetia bacterium]|jgi:hypothetical protein